MAVYSLRFKPAVEKDRVVYEVDPGSVEIVVHYVRHRRDVYRALR